MIHQEGWMPVSLLVNSLFRKFLGVVTEQHVRDSWKEYQSDPFPDDKIEDLTLRFRMSAAETQVWANLSKWTDSGKLGVTTPLGTTALITAEVTAYNPFEKFRNLPPIECPASPLLDMRIGTLGSGPIAEASADENDDIVGQNLSLFDLKRMFGAFLFAPLVVDQKVAEKCINSVSVAYLFPKATPETVAKAIVEHSILEPSLRKPELLEIQAGQFGTTFKKQAWAIATQLRPELSKDGAKPKQRK